MIDQDEDGTTKVFSSCGELHIFCNASGSITIKQIENCEDALIIIPFEHVEKVICALRKVKKEYAP